MSGTPVGAGCVQYPATPAVQATPAYWRDDTADGWTAGAHSATQLDGNFRLLFTTNDSIAVVCGITPAATPPGVDTARVTHGFYVTRVSGVQSYRIVESGAFVYGPRPAPFDTQLGVVRINGAVFYTVNGQVVYRSRTPSAGMHKVAASLYGREDSVG